MPARAKRSALRRRVRPGLRRWLVLAVAAFVALLYYQPLRSYLETRDALGRRAAEVRVLEAQRVSLERQLSTQTSDAALMREARRLAYVKPGERLFIVKGIPAWRRAHARAQHRATIEGDG